MISKSDARKKHESAKTAYMKVFTSQAGKVVLADMMEQFYDNGFRDERMARELGSRDVVLHIKHMLDKERA